MVRAAQAGTGAPTASPAALDPAALDPAALRRQGSDATLERLRAMILFGELAPGSVVSQTELAKSLGISTTPLREVIRQLQTEGLLQIELNRRPRVAPLDVDDLNAVYAGRIMLESLAISLTVPHMSAEGLACLDHHLDQMRALAVTEDVAQWSVVHDRFHRQLLADAPSAMAATMFSFSERSERYRRLSSAQGNVRSWKDADADHQRIADACRARDGRTAAAELAHHLARTALHLSAAVAPALDPRPVRTAVSLMVDPVPARTAG